MPETVVDLLMKYKNPDDSFTTVHPISASTNIKLAQNINVMTPTSVGSYNNGDIITAGTSLDEVVRKMLQVRTAPTYLAPTVTLASSINGGSYEVGTSVTPTFTATFTQRDGGALSTLVINKNGTQAAISNSSPSTYSETFTINGTTTFSASASFAEGAIKLDNFGDSSPAGRIAAGTINSNNIIYTSYRKYFWGSDNNTTAITTSSDIRALTSSTNNAAAGRTFNISVTAGQRRVTFAYPATIADVSSVKYVEFNNDESKQFFTKTTVDVEGASGFTAVSYKVYTYIPTQAFPSDMTFAVTI